MPKKNQIILTPRTNREFCIELAVVVYLESIIRRLVERNKIVNLYDVAAQFLLEVKEIKRDF